MRKCNRLGFLIILFFLIGRGIIGQQSIENSQNITLKKHQSSPNQTDSILHLKTENQVIATYPIKLGLPLNSVSTEGIISVPTQTNDSIFIPIPATGYTDPNYQKSVEKSRISQEKIDHPVYVSPPIVKSYDETLKEYEKVRDGYQKNSPEYNQVQEKINQLMFENGK